MEKYKDIKIDQSRYSICDVNNNVSYEEMKEKGYVFVPYVTCNTIEYDSSEYDKFMESYGKKHECCPKCGSDNFTSTLAGYILNMNDKDSYKDANRCVCMDCGDKHTVHDRVESK